MALNITNTNKENSVFRSYLVFGHSKTGKTRLVTTLPTGKVLLVNVENNLDSIDGADVLKVDCFSQKDWDEIYNFIKEKPPEWVFIDSISSLLQRIFNDEFKKTKDGRAAYTSVERSFYDLMANLKSLQCNIVCVAQQGQIKDEITGGVYFGAALPWSKLEQRLPYFFSAVMASRSSNDDKGQTHYYLQCQPDNQYHVGVRTKFNEPNPLKFYEKSDLLDIHTKITNPTKETNEKEVQ